MLNYDDKREINKMIDLATGKTFDKRIGDTPTDANQLVPKKYVDSLSFGKTGLVTSAGATGSPFPTGWTATRTAQGRYQVTHNLNSTNYVVLVSLAGTSFYIMTVFARNLNDFQVRIVDTASAFQDSDFYFVLI